MPGLSAHRTMFAFSAAASAALVGACSSDNFANIPADRDNQTNGAPGPDEMTMTTGDAGKRVACGVTGAG